MSSIHKFIDIGANLTDMMFQGVYHAIKRHDVDRTEVIKRAFDNGMLKMIVTGADHDSSVSALKIAADYGNLYTTVGCHPTKCYEFETEDPVAYLESLKQLASDNKDKVVAIGECGLDYDRLHFCDKDTQKKYFEQQLGLANDLNLPFFFHCRNAADDFVNILTKQDCKVEGVVHSFTGSLESMRLLTDMGFYIGVNGCSLKTPENLEVVKNIPADRLLLETDSPWCEIRPTHAGFSYIKTTFPSVKKEKWKPNCLIKGRNEPCAIVQVFEIVSAIREEDPETLCSQILNNTEELFFKN